MKSQPTKNTLLQAATSQLTNQSLQESIFSPTQEKLKNKKSPPLQKNKTSFHRTVQPWTDIALNVNHLEQCVCEYGHDSFGKTAAHAGNMGLNEMADEVLNKTVVLSTKCCACLTVCASKPPLR
jgi:predicted HTH domain antitoxin